MEGSLVAYKVFTNGSTLQASEINDNLMRQSVMVFSNSAARTAAITSPLEGMLTWLEDVNRYEFYNGTGWEVESSGMVLLSVANASASTSLSINNVFSSLYQSYVIYFNVIGSASAQFGIRLRASGTDATTNYTTQVLEIGGTTLTAARDTSSPASVGIVRSSGRSFGSLQISNPFASSETSFFSLGQEPGSGAAIAIRSGANTNATSYDGITFIPGAGNFTGTIRIYGVKN
jgi:hypothetical protein